MKSEASDFCDFEGRSHNGRRKAVYLSSLTLCLLLFIYGSGLLIPEEWVLGNYLEAGRPPSGRHLFGTDALGRDLLMCTLKGMSVSMTIGLAASALGGSIALGIGLASSLRSGLADGCVNWIIDLVMSVPHTILILLISFVVGRGWQGLLIGIGVTHWCGLARLIRGEVLQLRSRQYVEVSRRLGKSGWWILRYHLLPHLLPRFFVGCILMLPHAILHEASISFLGYGLPPEQPTIGIILSESMRYLSAGMWWPAVLPGLTMAGIVLLLDRLGSSLLAVTDPSRAQE